MTMKKNNTAEVSDDKDRSKTEMEAKK